MKEIGVWWHPKSSDLERCIVLSMGRKQKR